MRWDLDAESRGDKPLEDTKEAPLYFDVPEPIPHPPHHSGQALDENIMRILKYAYHN